MTRTDEKWRAYGSADWAGKLGLMRHTFSMRIDRVDDAWEDVHIVLDGRTEQDYRIAKPMGFSAGSSVMAFVRFVFALGENETKRFSWSTDRGTQTWLLSRENAALYVEAPGLEEGFFIRYWTFRDECLAGLEQRYGWGYGADKQRIEVPERDLESLTWLEPEEEFELVRYLDDGRSFETTDVERLLAFIDSRRAKEEASEDPDPERVQRFSDLGGSVRYYLAEKKCLRRPKRVNKITNLSFSWMKDNWEMCDFFYNLTGRPDDRHDAAYRRYGDLPDGSHFGVYIWPKSSDWPPESAMMIVGADGKMITSSGIDGRWDVPEKDRWPLAAAASPSGRTIVWLKDGEISAWHWNPREKSYVVDCAERLTDRLDGVRVRDAIMRWDGILLLELEDGNTMGYLCDADMVLYRWEDGFLPKTEEHRQISSAHEEGMLDACPDELYVMVYPDDCWGEYEGCGVKRVFFSPTLERIEGTVLAENPDLKKIVIPSYVEYADWGAFLHCTGLKELEIRGDLSRVASWDAEAFLGCPCEEEYLRIRNTGGQITK